MVLALVLHSTVPGAVRVVMAELMRSYPRSRRSALRTLSHLLASAATAGAEPEALRQWQPYVGGELRHGVDRAAPAVDGLAPVADRDELGVGLVLDDGGDDRVGILRLIQEHVVRGQARPGQLPEFQVDVVVEPQLPVRADEVVPRPGCERGQRLAQHGQAFRGIQAGLARHMERRGCRVG